MRPFLEKTAIADLCVFTAREHGKAKVVAEVSWLKGADGVLVLRRKREEVSQQRV